MGLLLFIFSLIGKVELLKKISIIGIFIIIYLIFVFLLLLPEYYTYYGDKIGIVIANFDSNLFVTNGICFYLFLNQYTVIPICNNLERIRSQRITKIIRRTDLFSLIIYLLFTLIGYFSMPNDILGTEEEKNWELFLIRPSIEGKSSVWVTAGIVLFGINLIIAVLVKGYFLLMYFNQILYNLKMIFKKTKKSDQKFKTQLDKLDLNVKPS